MVTLNGDSIIDQDFTASIEPRAVKILKKAIKLTCSRKATNAQVLTVISSGRTSDSKTTSPGFQLSVQILLHDCRCLLECQPTNQNLLELCSTAEPDRHSKSWSSQDFYDIAFPSTYLKLQSDVCPIKFFKGQLYPFQKRALTWLLQREGVFSSALESFSNNERSEPMSHGFVQATDLNGKECFVSRLLDIVTTDKKLASSSYSFLKGGILAEEMGLGKTVEMIALICYRLEGGAHYSSEMSLDALPRTLATLVVSPPQLISQWKDELQRYAPSLRVMTYAGLDRQQSSIEDDQLKVQFLEHDVVLVTYEALAGDIHYSSDQNRNLRHPKKYQRRVSPITQLSWWRVVLDEAQMIENSVNNAAKMVQMIPRLNAWAVSGTPVRKDAKDLLGLLIFLRFSPYHQSVKLWHRLVLYYRDVFRQIFAVIALRHTKKQIYDEIQLPDQKRIIMTLPFTQIEDQHYSSLYQNMCADCGFDLNGSPLQKSTELYSAYRTDRMRIWLTRLRQTCLHPEIGIRNRRALGNQRGPIKTVGEVLEVMIEQNETSYWTEERSLLLSQIRRGQILEQAKQSNAALSIWLDALKELKTILASLRAQSKTQTAEYTPDNFKELSSPLFGSADITYPRAHSQKLRSVLELTHICTFFAANACYQIKTDTCLTSPSSDDFQRLQETEEGLYEQARQLRKELCKETHGQAEKVMAMIREKNRCNSFVEIPTEKILSEHGATESLSLLRGYNRLIGSFNDQAEQLMKWRQEIVGLLLMPLVDEEEADLKGDEYEASTREQDELYAYMDAFRMILIDRQSNLTGQTNNYVDHDVKTALGKATSGEAHAPMLLKELMGVREELKLHAEEGSLRSIASKLRELKAATHTQAGRGCSHVSGDPMTVNCVLDNLSDLSTRQAKVLSQLDQELDVFRRTMNSRLGYYRQLQQISDNVTPLEEGDRPGILATTLEDMQNSEERLRERMSTIRAKSRYLLHLRCETSTSQRSCIICQQPFEVGVLTTCGHSFCMECLYLWWRAHRNCPTCKRRLSRNELHRIT